MKKKKKHHRNQQSVMMEGFKRPARKNEMNVEPHVENGSSGKVKPGKRYGQLVVVERVEHSWVENKGERLWLCDVDGGGQVEVPDRVLRLNMVEKCELLVKVEQHDVEDGAADAKNARENGVVLVRCKREGYISAWNWMYGQDKKKWNVEMFDGVNPALNKAPLASEVDNFCVVAVDVNHQECDFELNGLRGKPVGIFSMVVTKTRGDKFKPIGKQWVVDPDHQHRGIASAMMAVLQKELLDNGYVWFYIGCSHFSSSILQKMGNQPFNSSEEHDLYKYNVDLVPEVVNDLHMKYVQACNFKVK